MKCRLLSVFVLALAGSGCAVLLGFDAATDPAPEGAKVSSDTTGDASSDADLTRDEAHVGDASNADACPWPGHLVNSNGLALEAEDWNEAGQGSTYVNLVAARSSPAQAWALGSGGSLRNGLNQWCLTTTAHLTDPRTRAQMFYCPNATEQWQISEGTIRLAGKDVCLTRETSDYIIIAACGDSGSQQWQTCGVAE